MFQTVLGDAEDHLHMRANPRGRQVANLKVTFLLNLCVFVCNELQMAGFVVSFHHELSLRIHGCCILQSKSAF